MPFFEPSRRQSQRRDHGGRRSEPRARGRRRRRRHGAHPREAQAPELLNISEML